MIKFKTAAMAASVIALAVVLTGNYALANDGGGNGLRSLFDFSAQSHSSTSVNGDERNKINFGQDFQIQMKDNGQKVSDNSNKNENKDQNNINEENKRIKGEDKVDFNFGINSTSTMDQVKARADTAIDNRLNDLNSLKAKLNGMTRLSADAKVSLSASIDTEVSRLGSLKNKIDADIDASVLKSDVSSITSAYRIYLLVIPQVRMASVADRINTIVDMMTTIGNKFETRINTASDNNHDVSALQNYLSDYRTKIADAKVQAQAAVDLTASLTVDNGDQTKLDANKQALKDAQAKIQVARDDLKAAREDAKNLIKGL